MFIYPMAAMVMYIFVVGLYNFVVRFRAIKSKELKISHFRIYDTSGNAIPERVTIVGRHFDNQFQLPILFLITLTAAQTMPLYNSPVILPLAWGFVLTRVLHGYIHLGSNDIRLRAYSYFAGWGCVLAIWLVMALQSMG